MAMIIPTFAKRSQDETQKGLAVEPKTKPRWSLDEARWSPVGAKMNAKDPRLVREIKQGQSVR